MDDEKDEDPPSKKQKTGLAKKQKEGSTGQNVKQSAIVDFLSGGNRVAVTQRVRAEKKVAAATDQRVLKESEKAAHREALAEHATNDTIPELNFRPQFCTDGGRSFLNTFAKNKTVMKKYIKSHFTEETMVKNYIVPPPNTKFSPVWGYFAQIGAKTDNKAICLVCVDQMFDQFGSPLSEAGMSALRGQKTGSIRDTSKTASRLTEHLGQRHGIHVGKGNNQKRSQSSDSKTPGGSGTGQGSAADQGDGSRSDVGIDSERTSALLTLLTLILAMFISAAHHSFRSFVHPLFKLFTSLAVCVGLPSAEVSRRLGDLLSGDGPVILRGLPISRSSLERKAYQLADKVLLALSALLTVVPFVVIYSDGWKRQGDKFVAVSISCLDGAFTMRTMNLGLFPKEFISGSDGKVNHRKFMELLQTFGIPYHKITGHVTDTAELAFGNKTFGFSLPCFGHQLQTKNCANPD